MKMKGNKFSLEVRMKLQESFPRWLSIISYENSLIELPHGASNVPRSPSNPCFTPALRTV